MRKSRGSSSVAAAVMATDALRSQVAAKWQESFARLNRGDPGIKGLMAFSEVRSTLLLKADWT